MNIITSKKTSPSSSLLIQGKRRRRHHAPGLTVVAALLIAPVVNAETFFTADFNGTTVTEIVDYGGGGYGAQITKANLDAGTAIGSWTLN
ncbi:MAG: hypothetical protein KJO79_08685, partial [Verrucomicrobiae bacterium]|nr:hypothetical protein [Verrucomicrobiae bacterium]NNJ87242.1 hypothetical protein [Akkermansiaceae bacterium]